MPNIDNKTKIQFLYHISGSCDATDEFPSLECMSPTQSQDFSPDEGGLLDEG